MGKYFCSDCNQSVDDVVCPVCGAPTESLSFDLGSPDGRDDRYDDSIMAKVGDADSDLPDDEISLEDVEVADDDAE